MCATANEYMGRLKQEKIAVITKKIVIGKKVAKTKIKLSPAAPNVIPISITLLSILSERYPIGHWTSAPNVDRIVINNDTWNKLKFIDVAYTAPYPNKALWVKPVANALTKPNGETL